MRLCRAVPLLVVIVALLHAIEINAATASLNPIADAVVSSANPSNNYGGGGALHVSASALAKGEFQSLLRFDVASATSSFDSSFGVGNWSLESATLQLTATSPNNPLFNSSAAGTLAVTWMQNDSWTEGAGTPSTPGASGVTWTSLPDFVSAADEGLGTFSFDGGTSGTKAYSLTLAPGFGTDVAAGGAVSVLVSAANGDTGVSGLFNSRSNTDVSNRPVLTLTATAVPEPSAGLLLPLGALIISCIRVARCNRRIV